MSFFRLSKPNECELIRSQVNTYSPLLAKFIDCLFVKNNITDHDKIQKWIILIIDRIKNKDNRPLGDYDKVVINKNINLDDYLNNNKELLSFKQQNDIIRLFKAINIKFNVCWIMWDFAESLSDPILFINIFPTLYRSYIKTSDHEKKFQINQKYIQPSIFGSGSNMFFKKSQFELIIDRYLPLLQITNNFFKEKLIFLSFLFDEMIKITLKEFFELINVHIPLILTDINDATDLQKNSQFSKKKIIRMINNSISILDHDFEIISNFFKIPICHKITEVNRQLIIFNLFTKRYHKLQKSLKINIYNIKNNESNVQYISFIRKTIACINNYKETILLSMMKSFSKNTCPDFHFPMLSFVIKNSSFQNEIFSFLELDSILSKKALEMDTSSECSIEIEPETIKSSEISTPNENKTEVEIISSKSNDKVIQEVFEILKQGQFKDHFSFTKLCFTLSDQGIYDHNDILTLVQISRMCRREFSALSIHKLLQIASSNAFLNRTVLWGFSHSSTNPENFPDRMFGSPGVVTIIVFFIMRAFEFLTISSIPKKYKTKQRLTADTILALYKRACLSLEEINKKEKEKNSQSSTEINQEHDEQNKNINKNNEMKNETEKTENLENKEMKNETEDKYHEINEMKNETEKTEIFESNENKEIKDETEDFENKDIENETKKTENLENSENKAIENESSERTVAAENKNLENNEPNENDDISIEVPSKNAFQENDEGIKIKNWKNVQLFTKRGFQMIKDSIEIGVSTMNLFNSRSFSLFNNEINPADLFALVDQMQNNSKPNNKKKQEIKKKSSTTKQKVTGSNPRKRGIVVIDMINIGFAIINENRFSMANSIYFRKIFGELTRIPLQKFDLKNMCANFEPEFPLRKETSQKTKNLFLHVQDENFKQKLKEIIEENEKKENENEVEVEVEPSAIQSNQNQIIDDVHENDKDNENENNIRKFKTNSLNFVNKIMPKKENSEIRNKKANEND